MKVETVDIHAIHADPANARRHPERNLATIKASLARFGQQKPLVVDAKGIVRAGNGTLEAARELGWDKIRIIRTPLQGSEATAYAIADNRSADLAEWDDTALAEQLRALQSEDFDLSAVGYDAGEIDRMIDKMAGEIVDDPGGEWEGMPEYQNPEVASQTIHCHFATAEDVERFAILIQREVNSETKTLWFPEQERIRSHDKAWVATE